VWLDAGEEDGCRVEVGLGVGVEFSVGGSGVGVVSREWDVACGIESWSVAILVTDLLGEVNGVVEVGVVAGV
jgi:hypothetical protein